MHIVRYCIAQAASVDVHNHFNRYFWNPMHSQVDATQVFYIWRTSKMKVISRPRQTGTNPGESM